MSAQRPTVIVVDDSVLLREGVRHVLEAGGCDVVATAGSIPEFEAALAAAGRVDAVVLDIRMPPTHTDEGIVALESLRSRGSECGVLLLSMYASPTLAARALATGRGVAYLLKDRVARGDVLVSALRTVAAGGTVVDPEIVTMLVSSAGRPSAVDRLTARELEVLTLMAEGRSNLGISEALFLSVKTVETHVSHVLDKLGIPPSPTEHRRVLAVLELLKSATA